MELAALENEKAHCECENGPDDVKEVRDDAEREDQNSKLLLMCVIKSIIVALHSF